MGISKCSAAGCGNNKKNCPQLCFFKFPKNEALSKEWAIAIGRSDLIGKTLDYLHESCKVCTKHFHASGFKNFHRTRLLPNAVPRSTVDLTDGTEEMSEKCNLVPAKKVCRIDSMAATLDSIWIVSGENKKVEVQAAVHLCSSKSDNAARANSNDVLGMAFGEATEVVRAPSGFHVVSIPSVDKSSTVDSLGQLSSSTLAPTSPDRLEILVNPNDHVWKQRVLTPKSLRVNKMRVANSRLRRKVFAGKPNSRKDIAMDYLRKNMDPEIAEFFETQLQNSKRSPHGRRFGTSDLDLGLNIYYRSPATYQLMRKKFLFPSKATLMKYAAKLSGSDPGFDNVIMNKLKEKVATLAMEERLCALCFAEISLKPYLSYNEEKDKVEGVEDMGDLGRSNELAQYALVFMAQGIRKSWKQLLSYYFSHTNVKASDMTNMINRTICQMREIGLEVFVIVCDMGTNNVKMYRDMGITVEKPYFHVDGKEVVAIFDVPHIFKSIRNNFRKYGVKIGNGRAEWNHIRRLFHIDSANSAQIAPKLTQRHIEPDTQAEMSVKLAVQVLSYSVAAALEFAVALGALPAEAINTSTFVLNLDELFDSLNSSNLNKRAGKKMSGAVTMDSGHLEYWVEMSTWVKSWEFYDDEGKQIEIPSQEGLLLTLAGFARLFRNWNSLGQQYLLTRRISQDCLENSFSLIRARGGNRKSVDAVQFQDAFKAVALRNLMQFCATNMSGISSPSPSTDSA